MEPSLVEVALKVTEVPEQMILPGSAVIFIDGETGTITFIVIPLEVEIGGAAQVSEDVISQLIISPVTKFCL